MTQAKVVHGTAVQGCRKIRSFVIFFYNHSFQDDLIYDDLCKLKFSSLVIGILKQSGSYGVLDENKQSRFSFDTC